MARAGTSYELGPPPLKQMTEDFIRAYKTTVDFWAEDLKMKALVTVDVKEVSEAGPVTQDDNVKVSAIILEHLPVTPALGYRFDFKDRSIAFSGDTAPSEAMAKMATGADVLVHEAMYVPATATYIRGEIAKGRPIKFEDLMAHMKADHTPVEDVGRIAQEAGIKTLVLSHLIPAFDHRTDGALRSVSRRQRKDRRALGRADAHSSAERVEERQRAVLARTHASFRGAFSRGRYTGLLIPHRNANTMMGGCRAPEIEQRYDAIDQLGGITFRRPGQTGPGVDALLFGNLKDIHGLLVVDFSPASWRAATSRCRHGAVLKGS